MTLVYVFGSGECEQLGKYLILILFFNKKMIGLGDDQPSEIKRPKKLNIFDIGPVGRKIRKIVCGGMHTVALSTAGKVYTWGCNDDAALGREGPENIPLEVTNNVAIPF